MAAGRGELSPSQVARLSSAVATAVSQAFGEMPGPSSASRRERYQQKHYIFKYSVSPGRV